MRRIAVAAAALVLVCGCYHAVIDTGRAPGPEVIDIPWAHSFIAGLVPPATVESKCKSGIAKVETQHSFLNLLAQAITFSIYSPMQITVTCAASGTGSTKGAPAIKAGEDAQAAIQKAAELSEKTHQPVYVQF